MRQAAGLVFDELICGPASSPPIISYTSTLQNEFLALTDAMGIQCVTDDVVASTAVLLTVSLETSVDGVHWSTKSSTPAINGVTLSGSGPTLVPYAADNGVLPTLRYARLRITIDPGASAVTAHVRVHVTLRDSGGDTFAPSGNVAKVIEATVG